MRLTKTQRGFHVLKHPQHPRESYIPLEEDFKMLAQESSAIGEYPDALRNPGSSFLWIGDNHHLNREEVAEFVGYLQRWLETGSL